jgi:hypothetical protein
MSSELKTDLSVAPYYDDYEDNKNFHRILFKPRVAVQARELTQLQTILQRQISRFGTHIFKDGSVVDGVAISYIPRFDYVHVVDQFTSGSISLVSQVQPNYLITNGTDSNTAVRAVPVIVKAGFRNAFPNTNRFYLKYIVTGKGPIDEDVTKFNDGDVLYIYDENQNKFDSLDPTNLVGVIDTLPADTTGTAYGISTSDGIIYHKGFFIRTDPQTITIRDFDRNVDGYLVGFDTDEAVIDSIKDSSLNDNSAGFSNFSAPGADRLKLTPKLVARTRDEILPTENFFPITEFDDLTPSEQAIDPIYNKLGDEFARRTYEESGDYFIKPFQIEATDHQSNTSLFNYQVSPGTSYVQGYRVEFIGSKRVATRRADTTKVAQNQVITANYGQYVVVNEFLGAVDLDNVGEIDLYDQAQQSITQIEGAQGSPAGILVGKANVKTVIYDNGIKGKPNCEFLLYIFNIRMNSGKSFSNDAKSFVATSPRNVRGDFVLSGGRAVLRDVTKQKLIFNTGHSAIKRLTDADGVNDTSYVYRQTTSATLQANGFVSFNLNTPAAGATESLNISTGVVSQNQRNLFNVFFSANAFTSNGAGTLTLNSSNTSVTGVSTNFTSLFANNDLIRINLGSGTFINRRIVNVANSTTLILDTAPGASNTAAAYQRLFVAGQPFDLSFTGASINVVSSNTFQISSGLTFDSGNQTVHAQVPVLRNLATPAKKDVKKDRLVKIDCDTNTANTIGPWNIGLTDVYSLKNVWVGTTYANTNPDRSDWFILDTGQRDDHYEHARLFIRPEHRSKITSATKLLLNIDHFEANTSAGVGFFSIDSYPIDDANTANTQAIQTAQVPIFVGSDGKRLDLRNAIDFRPVKFNTASSVANTNPANTSITVNPAVSNNSFKTVSTGQYLAEVDSNFRADIEYYLPRIDLVTVAKDGTLSVIEGTPEENPKTPFNETDTSTIARALVPPYPSLTQREGEGFGRRDLTVRIEPQGNRRYTMKDIGGLERRIKRLEYYTVLNALEQKARDLTIPDANGLDRFKNGIFADPFNSHLIGKVNDFEYNIAIDKDEGIARPIFKTHPVDLMFDLNGSSNVVRTGPYVTLPFTNELHITQRYATKFRNATEVEWQWNGKVDLYPSVDYFRDEKFDPNININLDLATAWENFANSPFGTVYGDWRTIDNQTSTNTTQNDDWLLGGTTTSTTTTTTTTQDRIVSDLSVNTITNEYNFGTYVTDFSIQPYMRSRTVAFVVTTLKPNTRIYAYFDGIAVSQHCAPGILSGLTTFNEGDEDKIVTRTGNFGDQLVTDSNGFLCGIFRIPENQFRSGDRVFMLNDVDDLTFGTDAVITRASNVYHASNISVTKQSTTLTTREPELVFTSSTEVNTLTNSTTNSTFVPFPPPPTASFGGDSGGDSGGIGAAPTGGGGSDASGSCPLAQSFIVKSPNSVSGVFFTQIGLFFRTKDPNLGVTVYVMEVRSGQPDISNVVGKAYLPSSAINAPGDNTQVETIFDFEYPIYMTKDKFYAFMIYPDATSPEYTFWMGETGGFDVETGQQVFQNPYVGTAFRSANQLTWSAIQEEDVKFNLYRAKFSVGSGTAEFTNDNDEYIVVDGFVRANSELAVSIGDVVYTVNADSNTLLTSNTSPFGVIQLIDEANGIIHLDDSRGGFTANTEIRIFRTSNETNPSLATANNLIATATIEEVQDLNYHAVVPRFSKMVPVRTTLKYEFKGTDELGNIDSAYTIVQGDTETEFLDRTRIARSKSNESSKSSYFRLTLDTPDEYISPVIDLSRKAGLFVENIINNDTTDEHTRYGNAITKYISKEVVLADGQEAEDLHLYLTAYRPVDTDVKMYIKVQNPEDNEPFDTKVWTELEYHDGSEFVYSNPTNTRDYIEYEFRIPSTTNGITNAAFKNSNGIVEYTNVAGSRFVTFKRYSIKIVLLSSNPVRVPRLNDVRGIALQV